MKRTLKFYGWMLCIPALDRIIYYTIHGWFSAPTFIGGAILAFHLLSILLTLGIGLNLVKFPNSFKERLSKWFLLIRPKYIQWIVGFIAVLSLIILLTNFITSCGFSSALCGNEDVLASVTIFILLITFPRSIPNFFETNTIQPISTFLSSIILGLLFIVHVSIKYILISPNAYSLVVPTDAIQYFALAKQFFEGTPNFVLYNHYPPLYSLVIAPAFALGVKDALHGITIINILISSSAMIPIYLIARNYFKWSISILITLGSALFPYHFIYPYYPASENLYYPQFFWIIFFLSQYPTNKKYQLVWDLALGFLVGLAYLTRYQTLPLVPAIMLIYWLKPDSDSMESISYKPTLGKISRLMRMLVAFSIPMLIWLISGLQQGVGLEELLGLTVEGKGSLTKLNPKPESFFLWLIITLAYFVLIAGPTLSQLLSAIWTKSLKRDGKIDFWLVMVIIISGIFFITVFRHAWIAGYNTALPIRFVTRYVIYLSVLAWITAILFIENNYIKSWKVYLFFSAISIILLFLSYKLFFDQTWLLKAQILKFIFLDGHIVGFLGWKYFIAILLFSCIFLVCLVLKSTKLLSQLTIVTICLINILVFPDFYNKMMEMQLPGKFIAELNDQVISKIPKSELNKNSYTIISDDDLVHPEEHLFIHDLNNSLFTFRFWSDDEQTGTGRTIFMRLIIEDIDSYDIVERKTLKSSDTIIGEFDFDRSSFAIINYKITD